MIINIRAKGIDVEESITKYIKEKLSKSEKYFSTINEVDVFLNKQKYLHIVEIVINIADQTIKIKQQAADFRSAVDIAIGKIEQQLRKEKEKIKNRRKSFRSCLTDDKYQYAEKVSIDQNKQKLVPAVLTIDKAIEVMDNSDYMFLVFVNKDTNKLSIIYEKSESNYGLFEIEKGRKVKD
ncbi:MAG: ribosome-associated translation inhibitor RaiA [Elusimicrobiota bacterium]